MEELDKTRHTTVLHDMPTSNNNWGTAQSSVQFTYEGQINNTMNMVPKSLVYEYKHLYKYLRVKPTTT